MTEIEIIYNDPDALRVESEVEKKMRGCYSLEERYHHVTYVNGYIVKGAISNEQASALDAIIAGIWSG